MTNNTTPKTCLQTRLDIRTGRRVTRRAPHETPAGATEYTPCIHCGTTVYCGESNNGPHASQLREHLAARAEKKRN